LSEFQKIYNNNNEDNSGKLEGDITIYDSPIENYQTASINVAYDLGGSSAQFWRKDENSDWNYFMGVQNTLSCDMYNTDDIKRAFAGDQCWDEENKVNTYVRYYYDLF
jgi:hypothetical protein